MARSIWGALAIAFAALVAAAPAWAQVQVPEPAAAAPAQPGGGLTQRGIPAEATAENGVLARERALASGRRIAWERMLAETGQPGGSMSDQQIENMVSSIVIEQERTGPTRYSGRITVNFNAGRVRRAQGGEGAAPIAGGAGNTGRVLAGPASNWVEVIATYRSMGEWLELQRRLRAAGPVASVGLQAVAVDAARLRLGLRLAPQEAAAELAVHGILLAPATGAAAWQVGLAGG
jgi:hypothetical protein